MKNKQGGWKWIQSRGRVLYRDSEGKPLRIAGTHLDINSRKRTEFALDESEKRYKLLAQNSNDVIWTMNPDGVFTYISPSVFQMRGYLPEEIIGQPNCLSICPSSIETAKEGLELLHNEIRTGEKAPIKYFELEQPCKDGSTVWIETTAWVVYDENEQPSEIMGITRDINERKKAEMKLIEINRELDDFTFMVSHDLKNPVNIIKAYLYEINEDQNLYREYFPKCVEQADRISNYINDLLNLSRAGKVIQNRQMLDISILFAVLFTINKNEIPYEYNVEKDFPQVYGDLSGLEMVFSNLFQNSFRYHDPAKEKLVVNINYKKTNSSTIIIVRDNGIGIDPSELEKIFAPGYSTGGTGFGLAIAKKITEAHKGRIWAESKGQGTGATFYIELPDMD
jgi:PAS domain S-box-containing protein